MHLDETTVCLFFNIAREACRKHDFFVFSLLAFVLSIYIMDNAETLLPAH